MSEEHISGGEPTASPDDASLQAELDLANRKLVEAHKMAALGRLSAGIVHEINTPIGSIFSNNEVISRSLDRIKTWLTTARDEGSPPTGQIMETLEVIAGLVAVDKIACERISSIIRSLKTFARSSEHDLRNADVNEIIRHTLKLSAAVFRRRINFETEFGDLPEVECYPGLLGQVLLNLVVNAAQAIECEGTIITRSRVEGDQVRIEIQDSGRGIRPEDRSKIFQAGFTTKPIGEGAGIGLSLSREIIVETHHGAIDFDSKPGEGTTFWVRIPIRQTKGQ